tara:strand:- start:9341 stop:9625 length:285 start_codon:yes stop_codon:yes gene_type:complete
MTEQEEQIQNLISASNIFAKALFLSMEEGEGLLLKATNDTSEYKEGDLLVIAKLNGVISIVKADNVVQGETEMVEGTWVKVGSEETVEEKEESK